MNFPEVSRSSFPSCTKSVTIRVDGLIIKLKQDREVVLNGEEVDRLPLWIDGVHIRHASSVFVSGKVAPVDGSGHGPRRDERFR